MLDRRLLRDDPDGVRAILARRGEEYASLVDRFLEDDGLRRATQTELDDRRSLKNSVSKRIGEYMKAGEREQAEGEKARLQGLDAQMAELEQRLSEYERLDREILLAMPNLPHESVPLGGEEHAEVVKTWGEPRSFDFPPLDHVALVERLKLVSFEAGARLAGSGFPVFHGAGALLQRALINLMLDTHVQQHSYTELRPPFIVHPRCPEGTGQLPKFGGEMYHVYVEGMPAPQGTTGPHFYMIPTAEVPVVNYYREQILEAPELPIKLCAYSPCWRVEAGSYGKEARGLTRVHQFEKVELVRFADPQHSYSDLEEMTGEAERILEPLGLAYRRKVLPTGDMTFASAKTYDIDVYCPAEQAWREVSSASNTTDYQARRAGIRFRRERGGKPEFLHILNASGLALPRLMIALLETYQTAEGSVRLPEALHKYMPAEWHVIEPSSGGAPFV